MARFEELQMKIVESAKNHLEIYNMQVFVEQFNLDREAKIFLTMPYMEQPFPVSATVSFIYDAFQTGLSIYEEGADEEELDVGASAEDVDSSIELEFIVNLPIMNNYPNIKTLLEEINEQYPDTESILMVKEIFPNDEFDEPTKEYEISYTYDIELEDVADSELLDEIFEDLKGIMELIHKRTKGYLDLSWHRRKD